jgi:hypothetical protein
LKAPRPALRQLSYACSPDIDLVISGNLVVFCLVASGSPLRVWVMMSGRQGFVLLYVVFCSSSLEPKLGCENILPSFLGYCRKSVRQCDVWLWLNPCEGVGSSTLPQLACSDLWFFGGGCLPFSVVCLGGSGLLVFVSLGLASEGGG